ncbi:Transcription factor, MADS-box [Dillenia turbinata]|uniref:Transcription factor, MADS-box n=1 Tax=Dillenia turbinata TaxID=194707 RepID=A0AAN8ZBT7_9MAGN
MEMIQNAAARNITFSKCKNGLLKKATKLATLCKLDVGFVAFSPSGWPFSFGSPSMERLRKAIINVLNAIEAKRERRGEVRVNQLQVENSWAPLDDDPTLDQKQKIQLQTITHTYRSLLTLNRTPLKYELINPQSTFSSTLTFRLINYLHGIVKTLNSSPIKPINTSKIPLYMPIQRAFCNGKKEDQRMTKITNIDDSKCSCSKYHILETPEWPV